MKMQIVKTIENSGLIGGSVDPSHGSSFVSQGGIDYLVGALFILLGIMVFILFQKKAKNKYEKYKQDQLDLYNKNRGTKVTDYKKTTLYVPFFEKAKFTAPIMFTILFITIGLLFIIWTATGSPSSIF